MLRNRSLLAALSVSALVHLSMVTLFSIVFEFPVERIDYYDFHILAEDPAVSRASAAESSRRLANLPTLENPLRSADLNGLGLDPGTDVWARELPAIELPRLEFAEMAMLEVREEGLTIRSRLAEYLDVPLSDPWARIGRSLGRLSDALAPSRLFDDEELLERPPPRLVTRPAEGFEAYVEWMSEPRDRDLLFSPPIEALFRLRAPELSEAITLVFRVNPAGEVVEVLTPLPDEAGIVVSAARALTRYRFAPLEDVVTGRDQHGTLLIAPTHSGRAGAP